MILYIPNFQVGNTGIGYNYLDVVEYGGYLFSSKINQNIAEPLVPVDLAATGTSGANYTKQDLLESKYWDYVSGISGYTGTLPAKFNFMHDYSTDYHILKIQPLLVTFADSVWSWKYNPLNIDYTESIHTTYSNLSCIKNIPPPLPEPLNPWDLVPLSFGISGSTYSNSKVYYSGDIVYYDNKIFKRFINMKY